MTDDVQPGGLANIYGDLVASDDLGQKSVYESGEIYLTKAQAAAAEQHGWTIGIGPHGLLEARRTPEERRAFIAMRNSNPEMSKGLKYDGVTYEPTPITRKIDMIDWDKPLECDGMPVTMVVNNWRWTKGRTGKLLSVKYDDHDRAVFVLEGSGTTITGDVIRNVRPMRYLIAYRLPDGDIATDDVSDVDIMTYPCSIIAVFQFDPDAKVLTPAEIRTILDDDA